MAILTPKHTKMSPIRRPSSFMVQIMDLLGEYDCIAAENVDEGKKIFFTEISAERMGTELMRLLDEEELLNIRFESSWLPTQTANFLANSNESKPDIITRINNDTHRNFHLRISEKDIEQDQLIVEPLRTFQEDAIGDVSSFMLISKGFWLDWS